MCTTLSAFNKINNNNDNNNNNYNKCFSLAFWKDYKNQEEKTF